MRHSKRRGLGSLSVLVLGLGGPGSDGPIGPDTAPVEHPAMRRLMIAPSLLSRLQTLADGLSAEVILCLQGTESDSVALATDFFVPVPTSSTPTSASVMGCPAETIAVWHNHPLVRGSVLGSDRPRRFVQPPRRPLDLCRLSKRDIATVADSRYPFAVLSVDRDTWCWWSLEQVRELRLAGRYPGYPVEGQFQELSVGE